MCRHWKAVNILWDVDDESDWEDLPDEISIPDDITDEEEISDYISYETGFCHRGFALVPELQEFEVLAFAEKGPVRVELTYIGEGWKGDYDDTDPEDEPLIRFDVYKDGEQVDDASYCTSIRADSDIKYLQKVAERILSEVYDPLIGGYSIKKVCEALPHIS